MACSPENCLHNYGASNTGTLRLSWKYFSMVCGPENCLNDYGVSNAGTLKAVMEVLFHGVQSGKLLAQLRRV